MVSACAPAANSPGHPSPGPPNEADGVSENSRTQPLAEENERLRARLARTMRELYARTAEPERDALLLELLRDPLWEVRAAGLGLTDNRLSSGRPVPPEVRRRVRDMIGDEHASVRESAATLVAQLNDEQAVDVLLDRLAVENVVAVRSALMTALGRLGNREAIPAVLDEIETGAPEAVSSAASALARLTADTPPEPALRRRAAEALIGRYEGRDIREGPATPRESLVSAMGVVADETFVEVLLEALEDEAATVRLAAINALSVMGAEDASEAVEPLLADDDRGVRQAAISVVATLGGREYLASILSRTDPAVESAEAVRRQAWDAAMDMLSDAGPRTLRMVVDRFAAHDDAVSERIRLLRMLSEAVADNEHDPAELAGIEHDLGEALLAAGRYGEAATVLDRAWRAVEQSDPSRSAAARLAWIDALAAAGDAACIEAIADLESEESFAEAVGRLEVRLEGLLGRENHSAVIKLSSAALDRLGERMAPRRRERLGDVRDEATARRDAADRIRVERLCEQLTSDYEAVRDEARADLRAMSDRAAPHMLRLLREAVAAEPPDAETERALVEKLREIAPELNDYDVSAPAEQRLETIDRWLRPDE